MPHAVSLITRLAAGFGLALVFGFVAARLKLPALVGYLAAGIIIGPAMPGRVAHAEIAYQLAEVGVMLPMFGVGLHFSAVPVFGGLVRGEFGRRQSADIGQESCLRGSGVTGSAPPRPFSNARLAERHDRGTTMNKSRVEAFSDGVLAIIITIMVLELKTPDGSALADLRPLLPKFLSYVLSFVYVGIYWSNHHHLLQAASRVDGRILWANLNLMFWLSLLPLTTAWVGDHPFAAWPSAVYGVVLCMAALAWVVLQNQIIRAQGPDSFLRRALGADLKGRLSPLLYVAGIGSSFFIPGLAQAFYAVTALLWLVPDRRIERALEGKSE